jgi:hypothetical protein
MASCSSICASITILRHRNSKRKLGMSLKTDVARISRQFRAEQLLRVQENILINAGFRELANTHLKFKQLSVELLTHLQNQGVLFV